MSKAKATKVDCPDCAGTGKVPFATDMLKCEACKGTGKVKASDVPKPTP
jgi:DnaJ-class molecular chaperone